MDRLHKIHFIERRPPDGFFHVLGADLRGNKQPLVQMMYGQICGSKCLMHRNEKQTKSGLSRNQSSIMPENYVVSSSLNRMMNNFFFLKKKNTMRAARRKLEIPMPAAMPCKIPIQNSGETHRNIVETRPNMLVLSMPTNL